MENNKPIHPVEYHDGLTKREYFAGIAMQGLISKYKLNTPEDQNIIGRLSVEIAEELLKCLET